MSETLQRVVEEVNNYFLHRNYNVSLKTHNADNNVVNFRVYYFDQVQAEFSIHVHEVSDAHSLYDILIAHINNFMGTSNYYTASGATSPYGSIANDLALTASPSYNGMLYQNPDPWGVLHGASVAPSPVDTGTTKRAKIKDKQKLLLLL